jgi:thiamine kinase-like enzyme
MRLSDFT